MTKYITEQQLSEIENSWCVEAFNDKLEQYTGIVARPFTAYKYFDVAGNYIGNSSNMSVQELLEEACVEVQ